VKAAFLVARAAAILLAFASAPAVAQTHPEGMAVPAFFTLTADHNADWTNLLSAQAVAKIVVLGDSVNGFASTNPCTASVNAMIGCLHKNGTLVLGYVNSGGGCISLAVLEGTSSDPNNPTIGNWFPLNVDGIFFDNVAPDPNNPACFSQSNYETLFKYVHNNRAWNGVGPKMCGDTACVMINMSQYNLLWPLNSVNGHADFATTYEAATSGRQEALACNRSVSSPTARQNYFGITAPSEDLGFCPASTVPGRSTPPPSGCQTSMDPPDWYFGDFALKTAHVLRQDPTVAPVPDLNAVITQSQTYNAGFLYVSDRTCPGAAGAVYDHVTSYFPTLKLRLGAKLTIDRTNNNTNTGSGTVTSAGNGINCDESATEKCDNLIAKNTTLELVATPDTNSNFDGFFNSGGTRLCAQGITPCPLTLTTDTTVRAGFSLKTAGFTLTVTKNPSQLGSVTSDDGAINCVAPPPATGCSATYPVGSAAAPTLTARGDASSTFTGWGGDCTGTGTCQVTMKANHQVTANFAPSTTLTVTKSGAGAGAVTSSDGKINCPSTVSTCTPASYTTSVSVTLTATPASGAIFAGWTGGGCSGTGTCTVSTSTSQTVNAEFEPAKTLTVTKSGTATGTVSSSDGQIGCGGTCSAVYAAGASVTLSAVADVGTAGGAEFAGWTGGGCSGTGICNVTMSTDQTVNADFETCRPSRLPGCCPGDPCRPKGSDCLAVICPQ
jgi:hypothetical protein